MFLELVSVISLDEDQMPDDLQPGDYTHRKRYNLKDCLQPRWKDPYQILLTSSHTVKLKGLTWINFQSHGNSALDWPLERVTDLKIILK